MASEKLYRNTLTEIKNLKLQHIHVSTPFILTICEKKYENVACLISVWGLKWTSYQTKNTPTDEFRLWTVVNSRVLLGLFMHATLPVYSTSFVRSSIFNEKKYLTTNLQTLKNFLVHVPDKYAKQALTAIYTISPAKAFF